MAGENVFRAQPFGGGIEQDLLQGTAMDRELRPFVSGLDAARLAPDRFAVLGKVGEFLGAHAGRIELVVQAELDQFTDGMRQHVDADAERPEFGCALEYFGWHADLVQAKRQRQSADTAARDKNSHVTPSDLSASSHEKPRWATAKGAASGHPQPEIRRPWS